MMERLNSQEELAMDWTEWLQRRVQEKERLQLLKAVPKTKSLESSVNVVSAGAEQETQSPEASVTGGAGLPPLQPPNNPDPLGPHLRDHAAQLRDQFNITAVKLDNYTKKVNITRVLGGSTALVGGITAIIGFALTPVTMGLSALVAGIVGASVAAAGGMAAGGASIAKIFIEKSNLNPLKKQWSEFQEALTKELQENDSEAYQRMQGNLKAKVEGIFGTWVTAGAVGTTAAAARTGVVAARALAPEAAAAARVAAAVAAGSVVLNAVLIGISLYDIIDGSVELYRQTGSRAGDYLRQLARSLDEFARNGLTEDFL